MCVPCAVSDCHSTRGQVYRFGPKTHTCQLESWRTNKLLMKRYHAVLLAKDADVFGILIGTLGVGTSPSPYILFYSITVSIECATSLIPSSYIPPTSPTEEGPQKVIHCKRRQIKSGKACQLCGNRVLCVGGMSREQYHRIEGAPYYYCYCCC